MGSWYLLKICLDLCETLTAMLEAAFMKLNHWDLDIAMKLSYIYMPKDRLSHSVRVSMLDVRTFLLFFAGIVCSTNPDGHGIVDKESNQQWSYDFIIWSAVHSYPLTSWHKALGPVYLGESKTLQEVQNQEPSSILHFFFSKLLRFVGGKETEKSSHHLRMPEKHKLLYGSWWIQLTGNWGLQSLLSLLPSVGSAAHGTGECRPCAWCHGFDGVAGIFGL